MRCRLAGAVVARGGRRGERAAGRRRLVLHARLGCVQVQPTILNTLIYLFCCFKECFLDVLAPGITVKVA